jgi:hypothetical protein
MKKKTNDVRLERFRAILSEPPTTIEEYEDDPFRVKMKATRARATEDLPPKPQVLQIIPDFKADSHAICVKKGIKIYVPERLYYEYIKAFFYEASVKNGERPCSRISCESLTTFGFRVREFIIPNVEMERMVGFCYICHLHLATLYTLNIVTEFPIHMFCVEVDKPGEYKSSICLPKERRDGVPTGLYGYLPMYSAINYKTATNQAGQRYLVENEHLRVKEC